MDAKHNDYCHEIPHSRRGCYCWEGDRQQLLEMRIGNMEKKMDAGTMKDYLEDLVQQVTAAAQAMQESADEIQRLRAENNGLKIRIITLLKKLENESKR